MSVRNDPGFYLQGYHEDQRDQQDQQHQLHPMMGPKMSLLMCQTQMLTELEGEVTMLDSCPLSEFADALGEITNAHLQSKMKWF